jgi:hypothetical protein
MFGRKSIQFMSMKNTFVVGTLLLFLILSACKEVDQKTITTDEATVLVSEAATAYSIFASTQEEGTTAGFKSENMMKSAKTDADDYPNISIEPFDLETWPKTITVDYGPENVTGLDNHQRRGILLITADNFPGVTGAEWEITFDDFYQDNYKVEGVQTITYTGPNTSEHPLYTCTVSDGVITSTDDKKFYFEQQTKREWITGYDTPLNFCDDNYEITGTQSGKSSDGYTYTMSASTPLVVGTCCHWIKEGILYIGLDEYDLSCEIDYRPASDTGEDTCNNLASITVFEETYEVTLP